TAELTGLAVIPEISVTPLEGQFGEVPPGQVERKSFTIADPGTVRTAVRSVRLGGPDASDFQIVQGQTCVNELGPGGSCEVELAFRPGVPGLREATLAITSNAAESVTLVPLSGRLARPLAALSAAT